MAPLIHVLALATIFCTASCATYPKQAFDKQANAGLRTIAVLETRAPDRLDVTNIGGIGRGFGLLGAAVEDSEEVRKSRLLNMAVVEQREALGRRLNDALLVSLRQAGYQVTLVSSSYLVIRSEHEDLDYSDVETDAEALLDTRYERAGYVALGNDYLPWFLISARLVRVRSKQLLYARHFSYGAELRANGVQHFASDPRYRYADFDSLAEHADEALQGLAAGIRLVAGGIASDLR